MAITVSENGMEFVIYHGMKNYTTSAKDGPRGRAVTVFVIPLPWRVDELLLGRAGSASLSSMRAELFFFL